jgi:hypothetical protein
MAKLPLAIKRETRTKYHNAPVKIHEGHEDEALAAFVVCVVCVDHKDQLWNLYLLFVSIAYTT